MCFAFALLLLSTRELTGKTGFRSKLKNTTWQIANVEVRNSTESIPNPRMRAISAGVIEDEGNVTSAGVIEGVKGQSPIISGQEGTFEKSISENSISFQSGNPLVEITRGSIHLYRNKSTHPSPLYSDVARRGADLPGYSSPKMHIELPESRGLILCILAVPSFMSVPEFLQFVSPYSKSLSKMRVIRDNSPNKYMVLLHFIDQSECDRFFQEYNGKVFSSIGTEQCNIVFVDADADILLPHSTFLPVPLGKDELPTCPVCLQRLDSGVTGIPIMTILCNHSFHSDCLAQWGDSTCPVCRYCQQPDTTNSKCEVCGITESLWICVICGSVGCGRYAGEHAFKHFTETGHTYSLELETQRVWDYVGDGYVHRLVQNKVDGKVVELDVGEGVVHEKIEKVAIEYEYLLNAQLESQRGFYEKRISELRAKLNSVSDTLKKKDEEIEKYKNSQSQNEKERKTMTQRIHKLQKSNEAITEELKFHKELSDAMTGDRKKWRNRLDEVEVEYRTEISTLKSKYMEMEDMNRDLAVALEAQSVMHSNPEVQGGQLSLPMRTEQKRSHKSKPIVKSTVLNDGKELEEVHDEIMALEKGKGKHVKR